MALEFKLETYEGPLDVLLQLIEKNKIDIYDIPIALITEQYLEYLEMMREANLTIMSEFLVMATTLLRIKSQMLLPKVVNEEGEEEDPREELVQRLIEYKIYKYASGELKDLEVEAGKALYKDKELPEEVEKFTYPVDPVKVIENQGVTIDRLKEVFEFVMQRRVDKIDPVRSKFGEIHQDEVRIEDKIVHISTRIRKKRKINFRNLLEQQASKVEVVVTFLALLELMKMGEVRVTQQDISSEIMIETTGEPDES
ncbi:MAG: segregation/condensation protein A [Lachnospiraceae bacterium]|nr:segregation/condensation protein A [Lachnospiraceae bacterium]